MANRIDALDSLRGWAIMLVIAVHVSHWVTPTTPALRTAVTYGYTGVELFFVVSALSLLYAQAQRERAGESSVAAFYLRRSFRILPMLWAAMTVFLWFRGLGPRDWAPQGISVSDVALVGLGANGWHPLLINAVIPVGWSVGVEFSFYVVFPALALLVTSKARAIVALAAASALAVAWQKWASPAYLAAAGSDEHLRSLTLTFMAYMSLPAQLPVFMAGFVAYFFWPDIARRPWLASVLLIVAIACYVALVAGYRIPVTAMSHFVVMTACFTLAVLSRPWVLLDNPVTRWIGKVSFSAYLLHMFVIYQLQSQPWAAAAHPITGDFAWLLAFASVLAVTVAVSSVTYLAIERPSMRLGSLVSRMVASRRAPASAAGSASRS